MRNRVKCTSDVLGSSYSAPRLEALTPVWGKRYRYQGWTSERCEGLGNGAEHGSGECPVEAPKAHGQPKAILPARNRNTFYSNMLFRIRLVYEGH